MKTIILNQLNAGNNSISISYICKTTSTNSEYIIVKIGDVEYKRIDSSEPKGFPEELQSVISELNKEYPFLHIISRKIELHFLYSGFNSVGTSLLPVEISNRDPKTEVQKTGKVTEKYSLIGSKKVLSIIDQHADYELYYRSGFGFKGSQESQVSKDVLLERMRGMCCYDLSIQDNEIHVNGFTLHDMD